MDIRKLRQEDCKIIASAFAAQGWNRQETQYLDYLKEQEKSERLILLAFLNDEFAGYLTIKWIPEYELFVEQEIPEIKDLNVLEKFQNRGIASALMDRAEAIIGEKYDRVGIGVGLYSGYGAAQRLYVKRGFIPDGRSVSQNGHHIQWGDRITVDDDLILCFTKSLG